MASHILSCYLSDSIRKVVVSDRLVKDHIINIMYERAIAMESQIGLSHGCSQDLSPLATLMDKETNHIAEMCHKSFIYSSNYYFEHVKE